MKISRLNFSHLSAVLCLLSSACGTAYPGAAPSCAGINDLEIAYDAKTGQVEAQLCAGKENETVKLNGETPAGLKFSYEALGAKAFAGQMTQAEFNAISQHERGEVLRELITAIKSFSPGAPSFAR